MKKVKVLIGNYGSGKSELALNFAMQAAARGDRTELIDLDMVNTYFRLTERGKMVEQKEIRLVSPNYACSGIETLSLPAEVASAFVLDWDTVIFDVGGDDAGATALGRFSRQLNESGYDMLCVVNKFRKFISSPDEAVGLLGEIEAACRLKATGLVNNSHLGAQTTAQDILLSVPYAEKTAELAGLPLVYTTAPKSVAGELEGKIDNLYPVDVLVKLPW